MCLYPTTRCGIWQCLIHCCGFGCNRDTAHRIGSAVRGILYGRYGIHLRLRCAAYVIPDATTVGYNIIGTFNRICRHIPCVIHYIGNRIWHYAAVLDGFGRVFKRTKAVNRIPNSLFCRFFRQALYGFGRSFARSPESVKNSWQSLQHTGGNRIKKQACAVILGNFLGRLSLSNAPRYIQDQILGSVIQKRLRGLPQESSPCTSSGGVGDKRSGLGSQTGASRYKAEQRRIGNVRYD